MLENYVARNPLYGIDDPTAEAAIRGEWRELISTDRRNTIYCICGSIAVAVASIIADFLKFSRISRSVSFFLAAIIASVICGFVFRFKDRLTLQKILRSYGRCIICGYDLTHCEVKNCPECSYPRDKKFEPNVANRREI